VKEKECGSPLHDYPNPLPSAAKRKATPPEVWSMRPAADFPAPPAHGYRGNPETAPIARPQGLSLAISREAGARGGSIARKVGELLGWQVFDQETLDYLIQNENAREQILADLPDTAIAWANYHFKRLQREQKLLEESDTTQMIRLLLTVAARGDAVIVGRGAGYLLPSDTTLHARLVAPLESRVAYFAQWLRLNREEAAAEVRDRDDRRTKFLSRILGRNAADATGYDIVVNAGRLGIEAAAQFIGWAVRTKQMFVEMQESDESARKELPES
jgi:cytidylate kinase